MIFLVQALIIGIYYRTVVTSEMTWHVMLTTIPWYLAGINAYLFTAATCLEGTWSRRIVLALLATGVLGIYFMQPALEAYNGILPGAIVFTLLLITLSLNSVTRFKEGLID